MKGPGPVTKADYINLDYQNKQEMCIVLNYTTFIIIKEIQKKFYLCTTSYQFQNYFKMDSVLQLQLYTSLNQIRVTIFRLWCKKTLDQTMSVLLNDKWQKFIQNKGLRPITYNYSDKNCDVLIKF